MGTISENLISVMERISKAARKAGRQPDEVQLIAVTKTVEAKKVKEAVSAGARVFGENYVQEAQEKISKVKDTATKWHFIGHLQKNKAKLALELFDVIQTVDSPELATELNKKAKKPVDVLIEVNIAREKTKTGVDSEGAVKLARAFPNLPNLRLRGLMTIPPFTETPEGSRPYFVTLRRLAERINKERIPGVFLKDLSMGMSADFDVAIEEGATMVRIGTAIFGEREAPEKKPEKVPEKVPEKKYEKKPEKKAEKKTEKG
ncbi:MAG: YggS family pyridoxal phosphate-dependent enzyme [Deltaproteobacteria bacterium]|nr:YggS family pyridoxal phosphate-dependent enzyme [Deltaproteobacteria bacterium]